MTYTNKTVNMLLNYSKRVLDKINLEKKCDEEVKNMQCLIFAGMISYYGVSYSKVIYTAFARCELNYSTRSIYDIFKNDLKMDDEILEPLERNEVMSVLYKKLHVDDNGDYKAYGNIYVSSKDCSFANILDGMIHEINHFVNSINRVVFKNEDNQLLSRCGLSTDNLSFFCRDGISFEEAINVLQTKEIKNEIFKFTQFNIEDLAISKVLKEFSNASSLELDSVGYENIVQLVKPLYVSPKFHELVKNARINGNIEDVENDFDSKTRKNGFIMLKESMDRVLEFPIFGSEINRVKTLVNSYLNN